MSEPAELTALCADYDITEASGKVSRAEHDIVELRTSQNPPYNTVLMRKRTKALWEAT